MSDPTLSFVEFQRWLLPSSCGAHAGTLFESYLAVAQVARTCAFEIDGKSTSLLPDFCLAVEDSRALPDVLNSQAFKLLRQTVATSEADGRWFFEQDVSRGSRAFHAFARLRPEFRSASAFRDMILRDWAPFLNSARHSIVQLLTELPNEAYVSDVGIVIRDDGPEVRMGLKATTEVALNGLLARQIEHSTLVRACDDLLTNGCNFDRLALQISIDTSGGVRCSGVEIGIPSRTDEWSCLLAKLATYKLVSDSVENIVTSWPARIRVDRGPMSWPRLVVREVSHVKIAATHADLKAKFYLAAADSFSLFM